jgi:N-acetylmuramoyl-L-alanine amidase
MPKVYVSPSTQERNTGAGNYGTEERRMNEIADILVPRLKAHGFDVRRNNPSWTLQKAVADSNAWKPDAHVAIHSNAGGGRGAEVWVYKKGFNAEKLATCIYKYLAPITPAPDRGVRENPGLYETKYTTAPAVIIEVSFHDDADDAKWIVENENAIAEAILHGICDYFSVAYKPLAAAPAADVLYKVQVGAFAVKANADKLMQELKSKGYNPFIVKEDKK